jgi:hypothetical protein
LAVSSEISAVVEEVQESTLSMTLEEAVVVVLT